MLTVEESIQKAYYDGDEGFGSKAKTLKDAKKYNSKVTMDDVTNWFDKGQKQLRGYNSFVAKQPYQEYEMDLFFFEDLSKQTEVRQP